MTIKAATNPKLFIAIFCISFTLLAYVAVTPILNAISITFPEATASQVQMVYSMMMLTAIPCMMFSGYLVRIASKKTWCIIGLVLMLAGGLLPLVFHSHLWMLYGASALMGAGMGLDNTLSAALISDHFDGVQKGKMMGFQAMAMCLGGGLHTVISGVLAEQFMSWVMSYLVFFSIFPLMILFIICMPADQKSREPLALRGAYTPRVIVWGILGVLSCIFMTAFQTNIAMFIGQENLGNADVAGVISSLFMFIGIPVGISVGFVLKGIGRHTSGVACLISGVGLLLIATSHSLPLVVIGTCIFGVGFTIRNPASITCSTFLVGPEAGAIVISFIIACHHIGSFVSPVVVNAMNGLVHGDFRTVFYLSAAALAVTGILYIVLNPLRKEDMAK